MINQCVLWILAEINTGSRIQNSPSQREGGKIPLTTMPTYMNNTLTLLEGGLCMKGKVEHGEVPTVRGRIRQLSRKWIYYVLSARHGQRHLHMALLVL